MPVCRFFLEGRCRFGDKCWNQHPRGGGSQPTREQPAGYNSNRVSWGNQFQKPQTSYIQPSNFSRNTTWVRGGREDDRRGFGFQDAGKKEFSSSGNFTQNRFTTLSNNNQADETENILELFRKDIEVWETSGQWLLSCYSFAKEYACISGLAEFSPEELRLEYYNTRAGGHIQNYVNSIAQLSNLQRNKMAELKKPNPSTRSALIEELKRPNQQNQQKTSVGFGGGQASSFGSSGFGSSPANSNAFNFRPSAVLGGVTTSSCFGHPASSSPAPSSFGAKAVSSVFGNTSGFGASLAPASVTTTFCASAPDAAPSSVFGSSAPFGSSSFGNSATCTFSSKQEKPEKAATNGFGASEPATLSSAVCQPQSTPVSGSSINGHSKLYTLRSELSADDLREFEAKRFTLGRIPLWPPPIDLLNV